MAAITQFRFRRDWRELRQGRPGHRFQARYDRAQREQQRCGPAKRLVMIVAAIVCVAIGIVLVVMPGPAFVFFILAGGLLATESRFIARFMDWSEVRIRKIVHWAMLRWRRLPIAARVVLLAIGICCSAAVAYLSFRFIQG